MRCVSRNKGEAFKPKNTEPTVKHCGDSIMLWACATGLLYIKDEILKKVDSTTRQLKHGNSWLFQQDNDPKHNSKLVLEATKQANIHFLK